MPKDDIASNTWEILEQAGAFQFTFNLVPRGWFERQSKIEGITETIDRDKRRVWWVGYDPPFSIIEYCDDFLIRCDTSPHDYGLIETAWEDENCHRIELWEVKPDLVAEIEIRIDTRFPFSTFLSQVVEFLVQTDCVVFIESECEFVHPSATDLYAALRRSNAARLADTRRG